jgi:hypothetical protein
VLWLVRAPEAGEGTEFLKDSITERTRSELARAVPRSERQWLEWFRVAATFNRLLIFRATGTVNSASISSQRSCRLPQHPPPLSVFQWM